jgi:hypothetical protein
MWGGDQGREKCFVNGTFYVEPFVGTKKRLYKRMRWSVCPYVPISLRKLVTSQLLREEKEEEENWLHRYSFAPRD